MAKPKKVTTVVSELKNSLIYQNIKTDLLCQLDANKTKGRYYTDLVEDYMHLWITKTLLTQDIEERGVSIKWSNGKNQSGYKKNDSINELNKTNAQMLKIITELGIKPTETVGDNDEL